MGRSRKPTELKRQAGTLQPCRMNPNEPMLPVELAAPPDGLPERVVSKYYEIGQRILAARYLTVLDCDAVLGAARAYCDWITACEAIDANGSQFMRTGDDGMLRAHPAVAVRNEADRRYRGWLQSLAMTPVDRSKVNAQKEEEKSDLDLLIEASQRDRARPN